MTTKKKTMRAGGTHIATIDLGANAVAHVATRTARRLQHAVVAVPKDGGEIALFALGLKR